MMDEADEMLSKGFKDQVYDIFQFIPKSRRHVFSVLQCLLKHKKTEKFMDADKIVLTVKKEQVTLKVFLSII